MQISQFYRISVSKQSSTKMVGGLKFDAKKGWKKVKSHTTDSGVKGHFVTDPKNWK